MCAELLSDKLDPFFAHFLGTHFSTRLCVLAVGVLFRDGVSFKI